MSQSKYRDPVRDLLLEEVALEMPFRALEPFRTFRISVLDRLILAQESFVASRQQDRAARRAFEWLGRIGEAVMYWYIAGVLEARPRLTDNKVRLYGSAAVLAACFTRGADDSWTLYNDAHAMFASARRAELHRRIAASERARRYQVTCQGDHPLDLDP